MGYIPPFGHGPGCTTLRGFLPLPGETGMPQCRAFRQGKFHHHRLKCGPVSATVCPGSTTHGARSTDVVPIWTRPPQNLAKIDDAWVDLGANLAHALLRFDTFGGEFDRSVVAGRMYFRSNPTWGRFKSCQWSGLVALGLSQRPRPLSVHTLHWDGVRSWGESGRQAQVLRRVMFHLVASIGMSVAACRDICHSLRCSRR